MTVDTLPAEAPPTASDTPHVVVPSVESTSSGSTPAPNATVAEAAAAEKPKKAPAKKAAGKKDQDSRADPHCHRYRRRRMARRAQAGHHLPGP